MRKLTYWVGSTIDGFIAGPGGEIDFYPVGEDLVRFMATEYPEVLPTHIREQMGIAEAPNRSFDTIVMARGTYDPALEVGITNPYAHMRHYVVSNSIVESPDPAVEIVSGDVLGKIRELKQEDGDLGIYLAGGGNLAGQLLPEIDALMVKVYPTVAVTGVPLFAGGFQPTQFTLTGHRFFDGGTAVLTYARQV